MLKEMDFYNQIAFLVVLVGGVCWGLVGLFDIDLVRAILGNFIGRIIYIVVGAAACWLVYKIYLEKMKKPQV